MSENNVIRVEHGIIIKINDQWSVSFLPDDSVGNNYHTVEVKDSSKFSVGQRVVCVTQRINRPLEYYTDDPYFEAYSVDILPNVQPDGTVPDYKYEVFDELTYEEENQTPKI